MDKIPNSNNLKVNTSQILNLKILSEVNINEITKDSSNSILKLKINPNIPTEFLIINSNFTMNYLKISPQNSLITLNGIYKEHKSRINDISFFHSNEVPMNESFISGDNEGKILIWDSRSKNSSYSLSTNGKGSVLTLDTNLYYIGAGYGNEISIWDIRTMKQFGKSSFAHSEPVTYVKFYDNFLLSSSDDYIINIFNLGNYDNKKIINKNILSQNNVEITMNLGQSIFSVNPLEDNYLSVITSVNTFHIVNLVNCTSQYEFDFKNEKLNCDYILDNYYNINKHEVELFCGSFNGFLSLYTLDLKNKNVIPKLNYCINTKIEQSFNSVGRFDDLTFITCSDNGLMYVLQKGNDVFQLDNDNLMKDY